MGHDAVRTVRYVLTTTPASSDGDNNCLQHQLLRTATWLQVLAISDHANDVINQQWPWRHHRHQVRTYRTSRPASFNSDNNCLQHQSSGTITRPQTPAVSDNDTDVSSHGLAQRRWSQPQYIQRRARLPQVSSFTQRRWQPWPPVCVHADQGVPYHIVFVYMPCQNDA